MPKRFIVSSRSLDAYLDCPRQWYYNRHPRIPKRTNIPRLFGIEMHKHTALLYRPTREPRPFYFRDRKSAINAWFNRWKRALEEVSSKGKLILPDKERAEEYGQIGAFCISKYWDANLNLLRPLEIEKRYEAILAPGISFVGVVDQIRSVSIDWVKSHRPELVQGRQLIEGFENVVIVDLKTDYSHYDLHQFKEDPSLEEIIRRQYELHENLQATSFTFLLEKTTGKKPIGFLWYHLRSGKVFFTYREDADYKVLSDVVNHFLENINAQSFPKHVGRHCQFCDYMEPCREDRYFLIARPEEVGEKAPGLEFIPNPVTKSSSRQLRLKLHVPRKRREEPVVLPPRKPIVLEGSPWNDRNIPEELLR